MPVATKSSFHISGGGLGLGIRGGAQLSPFRISRSQHKAELFGPEDIPVLRKFEPTISFFFGRRGKGKSLTLTWLAKFARTQFKAQGLMCGSECPSYCSRHVKIAANFWMEHADIVNPNLIEDLSQYPDWGRNLFICFDEAQSIITSRRAMSHVNVNFIPFVTQIRKRNNEMAIATQFPQNIDIGVLQQIDFFALVDGYNFTYDGVPRSIDVGVWDWWGQWTGKWHRKQWPPQEKDRDWAFKIHNTHTLKNEYISGQIIPPPWAKNKDQIIRTEYGQDWEEEYNLGYALAKEAEPEGNYETPAEGEEFASFVGKHEPPFTLASLLPGCRGRYRINTIAQLRDELVSLGYLVAKGADGIWGVEVSKA